MHGTKEERQGIGQLLQRLMGKLGDRAGGRGHRELQVIETLFLGPRKQVTLIQVGNERYLVGTGADSVNSIVRVDDAGGLDDAEVQA